MWDWIFKRKGIDDLISLYSNKVSVRNNIRDKFLEIGIGEIQLTHDYNYITYRAPIRISIDKNYKITKMEYNTDSNKNEILNIFKKIKIGSKFQTKNTILSTNLKKLIENIDNLGRYSNTNICNNEIKIKDFDKNKLNFNKNFILF